LIIAAAGNDIIPYTTVQYPAAYAGTYSNVIAVSAIDGNNNFVTNFPGSLQGSCFGPEVTICAPGVGVYTTTIPQGFDSKNGTSIAAPIVAGVAGLLWSKCPNLRPEQVRKNIEAYADYLPTWNPCDSIYFGKGRVDAYKAVKYLYVPYAIATISEALSHATTDQVIVVTQTHTENSAITIPYGVTLQIQTGVTVTFNGVTIMGRLEMQQRTTINSNYIIFNGSSGTFTTSGTSNVPNNVNISNYGVLDIGGFLNGKYTNFNFGVGSHCRISNMGRIYMDEYNHMQWSVGEKPYY
jgi:subtilisin family serine protease